MHKISRTLGLKKAQALLRGKKLLLLDLDNTLYAYAPCHRSAIREAHRVYRQTVEKIPFGEFLKGYAGAQASVKARTRNQGASHSRLLYFQNLLETRTGKTRPEKALLLENSYWACFIKRIRLFPWVLPLVKSCVRQGIKTALVTDLTARIQMEKILRCKLTPWITFLVTSEEAGAEKPAPRIYALALKKAGASPKETVMIGDDPAKDVSPLFPTLWVRNGRLAP